MINTKKRADQWVNGDLVVLEWQGRKSIGVVNAVMQFNGRDTNVSLMNPESRLCSEFCVPNNLRFDIIEIGDLKISS